MTEAFLALTLLGVPSASAQSASSCAEPTTLAQLEDATERGQAAFADLDLDGLNAASAEAEAVLPCLSEPIDTDAAAAYHRLMGMNAFASGERERVSYEFYAARKLVPGYQVPEEVAPEGHPMVTAYNEAFLVDTGSLEQPVPPLGGRVTVGGVPGGSRGVNEPVIVQVFEVDGTISETRYLAPGEAMPFWGPPPLDTSRELRAPLLASTVAMGIVTGGLFATNATTYRRFNSTGENALTTESELQTFRRITNVTLFAGIATGALTVGLGTFTILRW